LSAFDEATLLAQIRAVIAESPFHGEGHREIWARLRALKHVRTSKRRVLRVMRAAGLLAPARQPEPVVERPHNGTILTAQPNVMWGPDATATVTVPDGQVTVFAAFDHCTAECVGSHAAVHGDRLEARTDPTRRARTLWRDRSRGGRGTRGAARSRECGSERGLWRGAGVSRHDPFAGIRPTARGNGCIERFFRTSKEQLLWVRHFSNVEELGQGLLAFKERYNQEWVTERLGFTLQIAGRLLESKDSSEEFSLLRRFSAFPQDFVTTSEHSCCNRQLSTEIGGDARLSVAPNEQLERSFACSSSSEWISLRSEL